MNLQRLKQQTQELHTPIDTNKMPALRRGNMRNIKGLRSSLLKWKNKFSQVGCHWANHPHSSSTSGVVGQHKTFLFCLFLC